MEKMLDQDRDTYVGSIGFITPPSVQVQASGIKVDESFPGLLGREEVISCHNFFSNQQLKHP